MNLAGFLDIGRVNRNLPTYKRRVEQARDEVKRVLLEHEDPYVAVSGGKDSMVLLHLVASVAKELGKSVVAWSHLSNASFPGTKETIERAIEKTGIKWYINSNDKAYDYLQKDQASLFGKSGVFYDAVRQFASEKDLAFVGTRASESNRRRKALSIKGMTFRSKSMGDVTVCNPLAWFKLEDIASYTVEHNIELHPIYSKQSVDTSTTKDGEMYWIRLGYTTQKDLRHKGFVNFLKMNYPDIYNEIKKHDKDITIY